jgi:subtilase family serine protease
MYGRYLTQGQVTARFGPSRTAYDGVLAWLESQGLRLVQGSSNRLTLTVMGTRSQTESAFATSIRDYSLGGRTVYSNATSPSVPRRLAAYIEAVAGLSDAATQHPLLARSAAKLGLQLAWSKALHRTPTCPG